MRKEVPCFVVVVVMVVALFVVIVVVIIVVSVVVVAVIVKIIITIIRPEVSIPHRSESRRRHDKLGERGGGLTKEPQNHGHCDL